MLFNKRHSTLPDAHAGAGRTCNTTRDASTIAEFAVPSELECHGSRPVTRHDIRFRVRSGGRLLASSDAPRTGQPKAKPKAARHHTRHDSRFIPYRLTNRADQTLLAATADSPGRPPSPSSLIVLPSGSSAQCRTQACLRRRLRSLSFHRDHPHSAVPRLAQRHQSRSWSLGVSGRWASAGGHSALRQLGWRF